MPRVPGQPNARLPRSGRPGEPPAWPLGGRFLKAEKHLWGELWALPQAVMWELQQSTRVVARYCRLLSSVETAKAVPATVLSEVRQLEDRLGLSPIAMARLRWVMDDETPAKSPAGTTPDDGRPRRHLVAVDPHLVAVDPGMREAGGSAGA